MSTHRILIVEDDHLIAENHRERLIDFGYPNCDLAYSKEQALILLSENEYSLALLDVRLKEHFEGIELGNLISKNYGFPFIYLTAHSDMNMVKKMVGSKPISYLSKPIRKSDLFGAISIVFTVLPPQDEDRFVNLKDGGSNVRFDKQSLPFAQSCGNYIQLKFAETPKSKLIRMSLENLTTSLDDERFIRVSRFYVINTRHISELNKKYVLIANEKIGITRGMYSEIENRLK